MSNRKKIKGQRAKLVLVDENFTVPRQEIIRLDRDFHTDNPPYAVCTCGWKTEPNELIMELGKQAQEHAIKTGHKLRGTE